MKNLIIRTTFLLAFLAHAAIGQAQVFVDGIVYHYTEDKDPIQVTIMEDDQFYKSLQTNNAGKFRVRLQPNHYYVINFSKPDHYVTKIAVDTHVPFEVGPEFFTEIPLEADLVRKYVDMDPQVMKKPMSIFSYNPASETFVQDDEYLKKARAQLEAFLYEAEEAEKNKNKDLAAETPEKSQEDLDSLRLAREREKEAARLAMLKNSGKKEQKSEENTDNKQEDAKNNNNVVAQNTPAPTNKSKGPSAPQEVTENTPSQDSSMVQTKTDTVAELTEQREVEEYAVTIKVNGEEYQPNSSEKIKVSDDLDIDIIGIPENAYASFSYKLEGKDNSFNSLKDDEVEYDDLADGQYTFILKNQNPMSFAEMRVPLQIEKDASGFPWWVIVVGILLLIIIIYFATRKKTDDREEIREAEARRAAEVEREREAMREAEARREINNRRDPDNRGDIDRDIDDDDQQI